MSKKPMTITHRGEPIQLPFVVYEATAVNIYSLFDYDIACLLCEKEKFKPIIITTREGEKKAGGFVAALDYKRTSIVSYLEWSFGIFVISRDKATPEIEFTNETSLFFQSIMNDDQIGNSIFCPKLILNESIPTEIGIEYYGLPKELGEVTYDYSNRISTFSASTQKGPWIMKASFPTKRGLFANLWLLRALFKAFDLRTVLQSMTRKEFKCTTLGSSAILAKKAHMKIKNDPNTKMFPWKKRDCHLEINGASKWGKVLLDLKLQPKLVCHVPDLKFEFSEPINQP